MMKLGAVFLALTGALLAQPVIPGTTPAGTAVYPSIGETPVVGQ
jgi:hypothetical protein